MQQEYIPVLCHATSNVATKYALWIAHVSMKHELEMSRTIKFLTKVAQKVSKWLDID